MVQTCRRKTPMAELLSISHAVVVAEAAVAGRTHSRRGIPKTVALRQLPDLLARRGPALPEKSTFAAIILATVDNTV